MQERARQRRGKVVRPGGCLIVRALGRVVLSLELNDLPPVGHLHGRHVDGDGMQM